MKRLLTLLFLLFIPATYAAVQDRTIQETFYITPDAELLLSHEYYKGIKVKSIVVKQIKVDTEHYVKNGDFKAGDPKWLSLIVEITDMKGKKTELYAGSSLHTGNFGYEIKDKD